MLRFDNLQKKNTINKKVIVRPFCELVSEISKNNPAEDLSITHTTTVCEFVLSIK